MQLSNFKNMSGSRHFLIHVLVGGLLSSIFNIVSLQWGQKWFRQGAGREKGARPYDLSLSRFPPGTGLCGAGHAQKKSVALWRIRIGEIDGEMQAQGDAVLPLFCFLLFFIWNFAMK